MKFYKSTLEAMKNLLSANGKADYADIVSNCIKKWDTDKNTLCFVKEFTKNGAFDSFYFEPKDFSSVDAYYWNRELFGALVAMSVQLANFIRQGKTVDIAFIRKNFGRPKEIIKGSVCPHCGFKQINMANIDEYIASQIISKRIIDGLENDTLTENIMAVSDLSAPEIASMRESTKTRIVNSSIPFSQSHTPQKFCLLCGCNEINECKFLKNLKENTFIPLAH